MDPKQLKQNAQVWRGRALRSGGVDRDNCLKLAVSYESLARDLERRRTPYTDMSRPD